MDEQMMKKMDEIKSKIFEVMGMMDSVCESMKADKKDDKKDDKKEPMDFKKALAGGAIAVHIPPVKFKDVP